MLNLIDVKKKKTVKTETILDSFHYTPAQKLWQRTLEPFISLTIKLKTLEKCHSNKL